MTVITNYTVVQASFNGRNNSGTISVPGLKTGDKILRAVFTDSPPDEPVVLGQSGTIEATITADDQVHQYGTANFTTRSFDLVLLRNI